jgi:putative flippase GtrA
MELSPRLARFAAVGVSGVFVNLGALFLLADVLRVPDSLSSACAIEISIISNFLLNNAWTFQDKNQRARAGFFARMYRYNLVSLIGGAIQWLTFVVLTSLASHLLGAAAPGVWKYIAQLTGIAVATVWNFLSNFFWVWAQREPGDPKAVPGGQPS